MLRCLWLTFVLGMVAFGPAQSAAPKIAAGAAHTLAISSQGALSTWGSDVFGQLGRGRTIFATAPAQVSGLALGSSNKPQRVGGGAGHAWALADDGTLWVWGFNGYGQLGDGTTSNSSVPIAVMRGVAAVAAGNFFTVAIKSDGTLWSWGRNDSGQLGDGSLTNRSQPQQIGVGYQAIAAGAEHVLALKTDNTLWGWGLNDVGQVGDGTLDGVKLPKQIGFGFTSLGAGIAHSVAVDVNGGLWTWGANDQGQLGDGSIRSDLVFPVPNQIGTGFSQVVAGGAHNLALDGTGALWSWGANASGQLGDGTTTANGVPKRQGGPYAGIGAGWEFSLATQQDGSLWSWGSNALGQLGNGSTTNTTRPQKLTAPFIDAAAGPEFAVARKSDGSVWVWGSTGFGLSGNQQTVNFAIPAPLGTGYRDASGGWFHTLALKDDGSLWAWGRNDNGQLGTGKLTDLSAPAQVGTGYASIAAGAFHSLGVQTDGSLWAWGLNQEGQLGTGNTTDALRPVRIGTDYQRVAAGAQHSVALKRDGSLWAWGSNGSGQLGNGTFNSQNQPQRMGTDVFASITTGLSHTLALKSNGELWAWGRNDYGQLGVGSSEVALTQPQRVGTGYAQVAAGWLHTLAIKTDGTLWAWGANFNGQIGDGSAKDARLPIRVGSGFVDVAAGGSLSLATKADGTLWVWGFNESGQLGDGTFAQRPTPALAVNANAAGFFSLTDTPPVSVPPAVNVPFFVATEGDVNARRANLSTQTRFDSASVGKTGSVFITASVPTSSLGALSAKSGAPGIGLTGSAPTTKTAGTPATGFTLIQLTPSGWQTVLNSQLIPYATGVLGDQLAAQTILNKTDTTTLKGAEFCVGYGSNAQEMINSGNLRTVATITVTNSDGTTTATAPSTPSSCVVGANISIGLQLLAGWNLLGNPVNQPIVVSEKFGDANLVTSVWKWDNGAGKWNFFSPSLTTEALQSYATSQGFGVLRDINGGEGYWVHARKTADLGSLNGTAINLRASSLASGWNLVATAAATSPQTFNLSLSSTPAAPGQVPINLTSLWAWDSAKSKWVFYAPSLDANGGNALMDYISTQGYEDFGATGKTLGQGIGFWVRRP